MVLSCHAFVFKNSVDMVTPQYLIVLYFTEPSTPSTKRFCWVKKRIKVTSVVMVTESIKMP
jgi:hypothetical protein